MPRRSWQLRARLEEELKRNCDLREQKKQIELQLEASTQTMAELRVSKDKDAKAFGDSSQKLLALQGTLSQQDRVKTQPAQGHFARTDPEAVLGQLCAGKTACLMPALLDFFKAQVQQLEAENAGKDKPLDEPGKFHTEQKVD